MRNVRYKALGRDEASCRSNYKTLFENHIPKEEIEEIRATTNKAWVLGDDRFKIKVERLMKSQRQVQPKQRGGDRRSKAFMDKDNNYQDSIVFVYCYIFFNRRLFWRLFAMTTYFLAYTWQHYCDHH